MAVFPETQAVKQPGCPRFGSETIQLLKLFI
jgi:hypothetical protein